VPLTSIPPDATTPTISTTSTPSSREPAPTHTLNPTATPSPTAVSILYQPAFGIDYAHPEVYLEQGEQTGVTDPLALNPLRVQADGIDHFAHIYRWLRNDFTYYRAGGKTIGNITVDELLEKRQLGGCHDFGLVFAAVVRELGYPAVVVESYSITWVKQYQEDKSGSLAGHVFVEVYSNGSWILVDPTNGWYVEKDYDPTNPVIPLKGSIAGPIEEVYGYYIGLKGTDTWAYGIYSLSELRQAAKDLTAQIDLVAVDYPDYNFRHLDNR
jgi:transglutaminase-like putative cysteine protease